MTDCIQMIESSRIHVLTAKLNKRHRAYLEGVKHRDRLTQGAALSAIMEECRDKEPLCEVARQFVKENLSMSYTDLLNMKRKRYI